MGNFKTGDRVKTFDGPGTVTEIEDGFLVVKCDENQHPVMMRADHVELDRIETFLMVNASEIPSRDRVKLRETAAKAITDDKQPVSLNRCPEHLREAFRRLIIEAAYKYRSAGQKFTVKINQTWI